MDKCNHLVSRLDQNKKCNPSDVHSRTHYWLPTGRIEAMFNGMISVDFYCKYCNKRTTNFITQQDFEINKKYIEV